MTTILDTWTALLAPRRALPIAAVGLPLVYGQSVWTADPERGVVAGVVLCVGTALVAPAAWRLLGGGGALGVARYVAVGLVSVAVLAIWLPRLGDFEDRFLTMPVTLPLLAGLFLVGGFGLGRDIDHERRIVAEAARAEALARDSERAELLALRAQLDPHFLFNTLNAIAEWCATDAGVAERAILQLSDVLRTVLDAHHVAWWPLRRELALCRDVLALHRLRDAGRFDGEVVGEAEADVPPLLLLPLVENALKHGPGRGHAGPVRIDVRREGGWVRIDVVNPGAFAGPRPGGQGLALVRRRLSLAYGDRARFAIGTDGDRTRATVEVPA